MWTLTVCPSGTKTATMSRNRAAASSAAGRNDAQCQTDAASQMETSEAPPKARDRLPTDAAAPGARITTSSPREAVTADDHRARSADKAHPNPKPTKQRSKAKFLK